MNLTNGPDALLLVSPDCSHCKAMHEALDNLLASKKLASLTIVDISEQPEVAAHLGVRSVPWLRIGGFVLEGAHTPGELNKWTKASMQADGWSEYLAHLLGTGGLALAERLINEDPARLMALIPLAADTDTPMQVRVGIAAILEELRGSNKSHDLVPALADLGHSKDAKVRADACHYLALTGAAEAIPVLQKFVDDEDITVRDIAMEGVTELQELTGKLG